MVDTFTPDMLTGESMSGSWRILRLLDIFYLLDDVIKQEQYYDNDALDIGKINEEWMRTEECLREFRRSEQGVFHESMRKRGSYSEFLSRTNTLLGGQMSWGWGYADRTSFELSNNIVESVGNGTSSLEGTLTIEKYSKYPISFPVTGSLTHLEDPKYKQIMNVGDIKEEKRKRYYNQYKVYNEAKGRTVCALDEFEGGPVGDSYPILENEIYLTEFSGSFTAGEDFPVELSFSGAMGPWTDSDDEVGLYALGRMLISGKKDGKMAYIHGLPEMQTRVPKRS